MTLAMMKNYCLLSMRKYCTDIKDNVIHLYSLNPENRIYQIAINDIDNLKLVLE